MDVCLVSSGAIAVGRDVSKINDAAGKEYVTVSDDTLELIKRASNTATQVTAGLISL